VSAHPNAPHLRHWPARLPRELQVPQTSLWCNLEVSATRFPGKAAYRFFGADVSFGRLHEDALALAGWLQAQGVAAGDRVVVFMQNCPQFACACYAIWRANAVVVPVNPMNREEELRHCIQDSGARVLVAAADAWSVVAGANAGLKPEQALRHVLLARYAQALPAAGVSDEEAASPAVMAWLHTPWPEQTSIDAARGKAGVSRWDEALAPGLRPGPHTVGPGDLALLPYTSGTTGMPKGCMHPHRTLMHNVCGGAQWGHGGPESVNLAVVPMFHITGFMYGVLTGVYLGATAVLMPRWDRELAGRLISRHRVTHWTCIPTMVIDLFGSPHYRSFDLSSLRYLSGGGAAMPAAVAQRLNDEFKLVFAEGYGLTETAAPSHANPPERAKLQCLGMPIFGVDSRVVDPLTLQALPPGESGEIVTHGPMVFDGYWQQPKANQDAFIELDGKRFFRTGDMGRIDEEGYFFMTDRLKRMINASGFKVWPSEVELLLYQCPLVQEACVIAARDSYRGETVKALVVLREAARDKASGEDIVSWAREHMAAYKVPRLVQFVPSLPKSGSGKVMWRLLQEQELAADGGSERSAATAA
jgi:fatty-acyl-CoA synthase